MSLHESIEDQVCEILVRTGCLKFGTFKLSSGILSPYYIDLRLIPGDVEAFKKIMDAYKALIDSEALSSAKRFAGVPTSGIAFASVLAFLYSKPFLYVRKEGKEHGLRRRVEGILNPGDEILVVDDVVTTGKNLVEATEFIRGEGGMVKDAIVLLDRQQGGSETLRKIDVRLHSFTSIEKVAKNLLRKGIIDEEQLHDVQTQITS